MPKVKKVITIQDQTNILPRKQLIVAFIALALGLLVSFIDQTSISVIQPEIAKELNAESTVSWAGTSLLIGQTTFQILSGRLSDIFNRKVVLLSCLILLALTQLATSFTQTSTQLYIFRGFAGIANGGITSLTMMTVSDIVTLEERGKYQGILGSCVGIGNAIGPFITSAFAKHVSWKGIFWFSCPLTTLVTVASFIYLPSPRNPQMKLSNFKKIDYYGFFTSSIGIILFLVALSAGGNTYPWNSTLVITLLTLGLSFFIVFLFTQWKLSPLPMMPLHLYTSFNVSLLLIQNIFLGLVFSTNMYFIPLYFQLVRSWSSIESSVLTLPQVLMLAVTSTTTGFLISKYRRYNIIIIIGFAVWTLSIIFQIVFYNQTTSTVGIVFIQLIMGIGTGGVFQPTIIALQANCRPSDRAVVIGMRNFNRSVGGSIGLAAATSILSNSFKSRIDKANLSLTNEQILQLKKNIFGNADMSQYSVADRIEIEKIINKSMRNVFIFLVPLIAVCFLSSLLVKDKGLAPRVDNKDKSNSDEEANGTRELDEEANKAGESDESGLKSDKGEISDSNEPKVTIDERKDDNQSITSISSSR